MMHSLHDQEPDSLVGRVFLGTVVDNNDPLLLERVRVTIPRLLEGDAANLPWCAPHGQRGIPASPSGAYGSWYLVPRVGSQVYIHFQDGNPLYPLYTGIPVQSGERPAEGNVNYLSRYGFKDPQGNVFFVDISGASPAVSFTHVSGFILTVTPGGAVNISVPGDANITGNVNINGNVTVTGGDVTADGISLKTHVHSGVDAGISNTGGPL
jgi:phage baseplate assembly protein gpV